MMPIELITTLAGTLMPPIFDLVKKKFIDQKQDTPEATISSLAVAGKAEVIPNVIEAYEKLYHAQTEYFNRDVVGQPSQWVIDLRASIRPITVAFCLIIYFIAIGFDLKLPQEFTVPAAAWIGLWFGDRMRLN